MKSRLYAVICMLMMSAATFVVHPATTSFHVTVTGKGEPILFIPGYGCSGEVWNETVKNLSKTYECHVFTLAGFAGVPPIAPPILSTIKKDILAYIEEKNLKQPVIVGHSMGGFLALELASEHPAMFKKLIVVDALPFFAAAMNPAANADSLPVDAEQSGKMFSAMSDSGFRNYIQSAVQTMVTSPSDLQQILGWCARSDKYTYGRAFVEFLKVDLRRDIRNISCPTLLMLAKGFGKDATLKLWNDQYASLQQKQIAYNDHALHFIMLDDPAWFMDHVQAFLSN